MEVSGGTNITGVQPLNPNFATNNIIGIRLEGNTVGAGTSVEIKGCNFNLTGRAFTGILVNGFFPPQSEINIFANSFLIEGLAAFTDSDGIRAENGEKNNIHIFSNSPFDGQDGGDRANTGIELIGSAGAGNFVRDNTFPFNPFQFSFKDENAALAIAANNFENTDYCGNRTGDCAVHFDMTGTNPGTAVFDNTMRGGSRTVRLNINSFFGTQGVSSPTEHIASGNAWFRKHPSIIASAWAECLASDCDMQRIIVHTLPTPTSYFTPSFHPDVNVFPPTWLFADELSTLLVCELDGLTGPGHDDELYRRLALTTLSGASAAQTWDMERHLYRKLKSEPDLEAVWASYGSFRIDRATKTVGKFWDIGQKIREAIDTNPALVSQIELNLAVSDSIIQQMEVADSLIATGLSTNEEALFELKAGLQYQLYLNDSLLGELQVAYRTEMAIKLGEALSLNSNITAVQIFEQNEKTVNSIWLQSHLFQNDEVTESQLADLRLIAAQCPIDGGMAVYRARGMLLPEEQSEYSDYALGCLIQERFTENGEVVPAASGQSAWLYPNPANEQIVCKLPAGITATLRLYSMTGQPVLSMDCREESTEISLAGLISGIYFCQVVHENGLIFTQKLSIQR